MFLMKESTTVAGIGVLQTYPNAAEFPDEVGALQTPHLEHLYNGWLSAKVGDTVYLPDLYLGDCRVVNTSMEVAAGIPNNEKKAHDGFIELEPQYTLKGFETNELSIRVPGNSSQKIESIFGTSGYKPKLVLILRGFKITGGGSVYQQQAQ